MNVSTSRVLLLYRTFGPSLNLCGFQQLTYLAEHGRVQFRHKRILEVHRDDLKWAQVVLFVRGDAKLDEDMARICHHAGKCVIYALDDDLLHVPMHLSSGPYYAQESMKKHLRAMLEYGDYFMSPSPVLREKYGHHFKRSFPIIEPSLYSMDEKKRWEDGVIRIGFAGSADRGQDIDNILTQALTQIKEKYGDQVRLEIFGTHTELAEKLNCRTYPYTESYEEYQNKMAELNWDIGLAPMPDTEFHACKHYNKLVEYSGFGIAGIYSDLRPYRGAVVDEENGLSCSNNTEEWTRAVERLIEDSALREHISEVCLHQAKTVFSVRAAAEQFETCLAEMDLPAEPKCCQFNGLAWLKTSGIISWYIEKLKKYGWKTPVVAIQKVYRRLKGYV